MIDFESTHWHWVDRLCSSFLVRADRSASIRSEIESVIIGTADAQRIRYGSDARDMRLKGSHPRAARLVRPWPRENSSTFRLVAECAVDGPSLLRGDP